MLSDAFEHAPVGYLLVKLDGTLLGANPAFFELSGYKAPLLPGWSFQQMLSRSGAIFYETHLVPVLLLRGVLNELAFDLIRASGDRVPVLVNAKLRRDSEGTPSSIDLALMDIRERRQYERELLEARKGAEQIAEIVRRSSDAILTISPEGVIQSWNRGAEQMFAYTRAEALGQSFLALLFPASERNKVSEAIAPLEKGQEIGKELVGRDKNGREIELSASFTPHMEAPGVLVAFSAIMRDVTSRKLTEKALIQSEKLASVGRLASSIAHEINNPLESVTNLLYILEGQVTGSEAKFFVHTAQEELARVSQIVTHTLRFHKQSSGRSEVNIRTIIDSVLALYRARLQSSAITVDLTRAGTSTLLCYEGELRQILANLIGNAFEAMRTGGGRLVLRSRDATLWSAGVRGVRITVADTGVGMDPSTLRHAFEPFFTTKGVAGTGLGLWITQELVTKNAGTVRVRSNRSFGTRGTVFVLNFPDLS